MVLLIQIEYPESRIKLAAGFISNIQFYPNGIRPMFDLTLVEKQQVNPWVVLPLILIVFNKKIIPNHFILLV